MCIDRNDGDHTVRVLSEESASKLYRNTCCLLIEMYVKECIWHLPCKTVILLKSFLMDSWVNGIIMGESFFLHTCNLNFCIQELCMWMMCFQKRKAYKRSSCIIHVMKSM